MEKQSTKQNYEALIQNISELRKLLSSVADLSGEAMLDRIAKVNGFLAQPNYWKEGAKFFWDQVDRTINTEDEAYIKDIAPHILKAMDVNIASLKSSLKMAVNH